MTADGLNSRFAELVSSQRHAPPPKGPGRLAGQPRPRRPLCQLAEHRAAAYFARQLTVIACDMPLDFTLDSLKRRKPDLPALGAFYDRQRFGAALRRQAERLAAH